MNEAEIQEYASWVRDRPPSNKVRRLILGLEAFVQVVNQNSDGWPYWSLASKSATKLTDWLLENRVAIRADRKGVMNVDQKLFVSFIRPIKTLCKKRELPFPQAAFDGLGEAEPYRYKPYSSSDLDDEAYEVGKWVDGTWDRVAVVQTETMAKTLAAVLN